jgi:hypothetical protein
MTPARVLILGLGHVPTLQLRHFPEFELALQDRNDAF